MTRWKLARSIRLTLSGSTAVSGDVTLNAPAVANAFTLSGPTTGTTGSASTFTVTPNGTMGATVTVIPAADNGGTVNPSSLVFTSGSSSSQTFTVNRAGDGTSVVSITNNGGLTNTPASISYTTTAVVIGALSTSFTLTSTASGTNEFTIGHAFKQGEVPSGSDVAIGNANAQIKPKNYWPDGSLKFAIVSGTYTSTANVASTITLTIGSASSGTALTTSALAAVTASIDAGAFGSASFGTTEWASPFETWVTGHKMSSWVYRKQIGSDAHLVAWLEVRYYDTGAVEILPWVENGYSMVSGPTQKSAVYTFTLGGSTRFSQNIDLLHHQRTVLVSGTITSHWLGTAVDVIVKHDGDYMQATGLVPAYLAKTPTNAAAVTSLVSTFTPLQLSDFANGNAMSSGGAAIHIGLLPQWDVVYLTSTAPSTYKSVIFNGYSMGRYPIHYRNENDGNRWARLSLFPTTQFGREPEGGYTTTPATSGTQPPHWDNAHQPSVCMVAYLVTGRRYFLDEVQAAASYGILDEVASSRENGSGLFKTTANGNTRHVAWALRNVAQAIAATPDSDTTTLTELRATFTNNVNYYHAKYVAQTAFLANPTRFLQDNDYDQSGTNQYKWQAPWQQDYAQAAFGYAIDMGLGLSAPVATKFLEFFHWKAPSIVGRLGFTVSTDYLYRDFNPSTIAEAEYGVGHVAPNYENGTGPWFASWGAIYDVTFGGSLAENASSIGPFASRGAKDEGDIRLWYIGDSKSTAAIAAIAYCVKHGATGAEDAYQRLTSASNWYSIVSDLDSQPLWGVAPYATPKWARGVGVNQWVEITGSGMELVPPAQEVTAATAPTRAVGWFAPSNRLQSYCGMTVDTRRSTLWTVAAGGHGDYWQNELVKQDLRLDSPVWEMHFAGSSGVQVNHADASNPRYLDGQPASRHTYYSTQFLCRHGRAFAGAGGSVSPQGSGMNANDGFDVDATTSAGWSVPLAYQNAPYAGIEPAICKDPTTETIYHWDSGAVFKFTPSIAGPTGAANSGGTWSTFVGNSGINNGKEGATAVDTRRNRLLWTHGYGSEQAPVGIPRLLNLATAQITTGTAFSGPAAAALLAEGNGAAGLVYVPTIDAYLMQFGRAGAATYKIDAATLSVSMLTTTIYRGQSSIPVCAGAGVGNRAVYNKWQFVPELRGVVYVPGSVDQFNPSVVYNTWFLRLY